MLRLMGLVALSREPELEVNGIEKLTADDSGEKD